MTDEQRERRSACCKAWKESRTPEKVESDKQRHLEYLKGYFKKPENVERRRKVAKARRAALTPEKLEAVRKVGADWMRKQYKEDPEKRAERQAKARQWAVKHAAEVSEYQRAKKLKRKYGITEDQYRALYDKQVV